MTDGRVFLGIATLICIGNFANGVRFSRMTENPWAQKRLFGLRIEGWDMPVAKLRRMGLLFMVTAPIFWLFVVAMCFGLFGPVEGIRTIGGAS